MTINTVQTWQLEGGADVPGNDKYYGTDTGGTIGYFDLPTAGLGQATFSEGITYWAPTNINGSFLTTSPWLGMNDEDSPSVNSTYSMFPANRLGTDILFPSPGGTTFDKVYYADDGVNMYVARAANAGPTNVNVYSIPHGSDPSVNGNWTFIFDASVNFAGSNFLQLAGVSSNGHLVFYEESTGITQEIDTGGTTQATWTLGTTGGTMYTTNLSTTYVVQQGVNVKTGTIGNATLTTVGKTIVNQDLHLFMLDQTLYCGVSAIGGTTSLTKGGFTYSPIFKI